MWLFLSRRIRTWLVLAVGVPLARLLARKVRALVSARRGGGAQ
jgi:hypothetical protein